MEEQGGTHMEREPIKRSPLRLRLGTAYYGTLRKLRWSIMRTHFARERTEERLPCCAASHHTLLRRKLKDVDMWMQENKIINLRIAAARLDGLLLRSGEVFSYWY